MKNLPQITDAEYNVMRVLWEKGKCTSSEIIEQILKKRDWKPKTVHTLITRLVAKKAVLAEKTEAKAFIYSPIVSKSEYTQSENRNFINRLYDGSLNMMLASFVKEKSLSAEEIEDLKAILEGREI